MRRQCAYNISDLHFYDRMSRIYSPISCVCVSLLFFRLVVELSTGNGRNSGKRFGHSAKVIHFNRQVRRLRSVSVNQLTRRLTLGILVRNRCNPTFGLELEFDFVRKIKSQKTRKQTWNPWLYCLYRLFLFPKPLAQRQREAKRRNKVNTGVDTDIECLSVRVCSEMDEKPAFLIRRSISCSRLS